MLGRQRGLVASLVVGAGIAYSRYQRRYAAGEIDLANYDQTRKTLT